MEMPSSAHEKDIGAEARELSEAFESLVRMARLLHPNSRAFNGLANLHAGLSAAEDIRLRDMAPKRDYLFNSAIISSTGEYGSTVVGIGKSRRSAYHLFWGIFQDHGGQYTLATLRMIDDETFSIGGVEGFYIAKDTTSHELIPFEIMRPADNAESYIAQPLSDTAAKGLYMELRKAAASCVKKLAAAEAWQNSRSKNTSSKKKHSRTVEDITATNYL